MRTRNVLFAVGIATVAMLGGPLSRPLTAQITRQGLPLAGACRHDNDTSQTDHLRHEQALALARAINRAEGLAAERTREYQPLQALQNLPPTPQGFRVRLHADTSGYIFSIKDERDPCHFGVFSDEGGRLYESSPQVPQNAS